MDVKCPHGCDAMMSKGRLVKDVDGMTTLLPFLYCPNCDCSYYAYWGLEGLQPKLIERPYYPVTK